MLGRQRLAGEHVEHRAGEAALAQGREQRRLVHHRAPADVEEPRRPLHCCEHARTNQPARRLREREHHHHEVGVA